jgi:hypothetical protein
MLLQESIRIYQNSEPSVLGVPFLEVVPWQFFSRLSLNFYDGVHILNVNSLNQVDPFYPTDGLQ